MIGVPLVPFQFPAADGSLGRPLLANGSRTLAWGQDLRTSASPTFADLTLSGLTSGRIPYVATGGQITDSPKLTFVAGGSNLAIGNDYLTFASAGPVIRAMANSSQITLRTHNSGGTVQDFIFNPDGIVVIPRSIRIYMNGDDAVGSGPHLYVANAANTRAWALYQLSGSNHMDFWYFNGTSWTALHRWANDGSLGLGTGQSGPTISDGIGLHVNGKILRLATAKTPASAAATGNAGEICWDSSYIYVAVAMDTWKRAALATW